MMSADQAQKLREMVGTEKKTVSKSFSIKSISITSGKGGVGKSNTSIAIAAALSRLGHKVLLLDGDFGLANLHILLGIAPHYNLSHVAKGECELEDIISEGPAGIKLIPGASGVMSLADSRPSIVNDLIKGLKSFEHHFDYLIVDGGAGIHDTALRLTTSSDRAIVIITPEPTSLADAYAVIKNASTRNFTKLSVIVNMAENDEEGKEAFLKLAAMSQKYLNFEPTLLGIIPYDRSIPKLIRSQKNFFIDNNDSRLSIRAGNIARILTGVKPLDNRSFFDKLFKRG